VGTVVEVENTVEETMMEIVQALQKTALVQENIMEEVIWWKQTWSWLDWGFLLHWSSTRCENKYW
jgi:hypothetical protein